MDFNEYKSSSYWLKKSRAVGITSDAFELAVALLLVAFCIVGAAW